MGTSTPPSTPTGASPAREKVYVKIPKAGPGQGYRAPKNYQRPLLDTLSRLAIIALAASLPIAPALIFAILLGSSEINRNELLWVWIPMIVIVEVIGVLVAIGVGREALGIAGSNGYGRRTR